MKRSPMPRRLEPMPRTAIRPKAKKNQRSPDTYMALRSRSGGRCEVGQIIARGISDMRLDVNDVATLTRAAEQCWGEGTDPHELRKKSAQGSLDNLDNLLWSCRVCNSFVEDRPRLAHELGLVVRCGDANYDALGRANDEGEN